VFKVSASESRLYNPAVYMHKDTIVGIAFSEISTQANYKLN